MDFNILILIPEKRNWIGKIKIKQSIDPKKIHNQDQNQAANNNRTKTPKQGILKKQTNGGKQTNSVRISSLPRIHSYEPPSTRTRSVAAKRTKKNNKP